MENEYNYKHSNGENVNLRSPKGRKPWQHLEQWLARRAARIQDGVIGATDGTRTHQCSICCRLMTWTRKTDLGCQMLPGTEMLWTSSSSCVWWILVSVSLPPDSCLTCQTCFMSDMVLWSTENIQVTGWTFTSEVLISFHGWRLMQTDDYGVLSICSTSVYDLIFISFPWCS